MKTDKEIEDHYSEGIDFYANNWVCTFEDMIYYRQMIEQARFYVSRHAGSPQADEWLEKYDKILECETDS